MGLEQNLQWARLGAAHVRGQRLRSDNISVTASLDPVLRQCVNDVRFVQHRGTVLGVRDHHWSTPRLNLGDGVTTAEADVIRAARCGNCMEQAAVAFEYPDRVHPDARPIHYCEARLLDHVFVLVGPARAPRPDGVTGLPCFRVGGDADDQDADALADTAVCDPWIEERYPGRGVYPARDLVGGMFRVAQVLREVLAANDRTSEEIRVATGGMTAGGPFEFLVRYSK